MSEFVTDDNGNSATIDYWGSVEAARAALASLKNCRNCSDCIGCSNCSDCSECHNCSDCYGCVNCRNCNDCSNCIECIGCNDCNDCRNCNDCNDCSYCSNSCNCNYCNECIVCNDCHGCNYCDNCSDCSVCRGCSNCSGCIGNHIQPAIPKIENIHSAVYAAASQPNTFDMMQWHCGTTHCRAGWVVTLAGSAGKALEDYWGTNHAAWLIYKASDPEIKGRPDFFGSNNDALSDMKRLADIERKQANDPIIP